MHRCIDFCGVAGFVVCLCVTINGLSYLVTQQLAEFYQTNKTVDISKLDVEFSFCFYTVLTAGIACVFSVAFSLLCRRSCHAASGWCPESMISRVTGVRRRPDARLIDSDCNQMCVSAGAGTPVSALPPPYTP